MLAKGDKLAVRLAKFLDAESIANSKYDLLVVEALEVGVRCFYHRFYRYFHSYI